MAVFFPCLLPHLFGPQETYVAKLYVNLASTEDGNRIYVQAVKGKKYSGCIPPFSSTSFSWTSKTHEAKMKGNLASNGEVNSIDVKAV